MHSRSHCNFHTINIPSTRVAISLCWYPAYCSVAALVFILASEILAAISTLFCPAITLLWYCVCHNASLCN